jgi:thiosulfate/3-mercaptopyruvate sulfurtransferase
MPSTLVSTGDLAAVLGSPSLVVIDVRHDLASSERWGEDAYRAGHIPGAVFAHLDRDLSAPKTGRNGRHPLPSVEAAAATFGRLGIAASAQVVAYDQASGMYAARLWWMLRWLGHDAVAVLDGGFAAWQSEGRAIESGVREPQAATFVPKPRAAWVDAARVEANLATRELLLVDARAPERYRGEVEPLDKAAGHIPGAINRPFAANLDANGRFKSPAALRSELEAAVQGHAPERIVHQCGSGVSACHNMLAFAHAGLSEGLLYPGSWSEWSADPARPVARG